MSQLIEWGSFFLIGFACCMILESRIRTALTELTRTIRQRNLERCNTCPIKLEPAPEVDDDTDERRPLPMTS